MTSRPLRAGISFVIVGSSVMAASESERTAVEAAARTIGQQTEVYRASTETDIERAFMAIAQRHLGALLVTGDPFFLATRKYLVALAASYAIPTIYWAREYVDQGGLISYGASQTDAFSRGVPLAIAVGR